MKKRYTSLNMGVGLLLMFFIIGGGSFIIGRKTTAEKQEEQNKRLEIDKEITKDIIEMLYSAKKSKYCSGVYFYKEIFTETYQVSITTNINAYRENMQYESKDLKSIKDKVEKVIFSLHELEKNILLQRVE